MLKHPVDSTRTGEEHEIMKNLVFFFKTKPVPIFFKEIPIAHGDQAGWVSLGDLMDCSIQKKAHKSGLFSFSKRLTRKWLISYSPDGLNPSEQLIEGCHFQRSIRLHLVRLELGNKKKRERIL